MYRAAQNTEKTQKDAKYCYKYAFCQDDGFGLKGCLLQKTY